MSDTSIKESVREALDDFQRDSQREAAERMETYRNTLSKYDVKLAVRDELKAMLPYLTILIVLSTWTYLDAQVMLKAIRKLVPPE